MVSVQFLPSVLRALFNRSIWLVALSVSFGAVAEPVISWKGSWQQGSLLLGQVKPGYSILHNNQLIQTTDKGYFLFGLGRNAGESSTFVISDPAGTSVEQVYSVASREYLIQRVEGVPQRTVEPPAEQLQRIKSDARLVKAARQQITDKTDFLQGFIKPLDGPKTGVYGSQRFYNGVAKSPHYGVDYAAPTGAVVVAPAAGVVRLAHPDLLLRWHHDYRPRPWSLIQLSPSQ